MSITIPAFSFSTVSSIVSEPGASLRLGQLIAERFPAVKRVLIVTDPGVGYRFAA